ncbi:MAG: hypothetical protein M0P12_01275 [Paludibacteraceae bacterium]|nr:hypothetical protein [Paludibacteraceae bacterium]
MAKKMKVVEVVVTGKYANAVTQGCEINRKLVKLTEEQKEMRDTLLDKTVKIPETAQSARLTVKGTEDSVLLSLRRKVAVEVTDDLKARVLGGNYIGLLDVKRNIGLENPNDIAKAIAVLTASGIICKENWEVKTTSDKLEKFRDNNGADEVLDAAIKIEEEEVVKFEAEAGTKA